MSILEKSFINMILITCILVVFTVNAYCFQIQLLGDVFVNYSLILGSGDVDHSGKEKIIMYSEFYGTLKALDENFNFEYIPEPCTYIKGELSVIAVSDLNNNGFDEIIVGQSGVNDINTDPSIYIVEKIDEKYEVIWESKYFGGITRFFVVDDKIFVNVYDYRMKKENIYVLEYIAGDYKFTNSMEIKKDEYVIYIGMLCDTHISILTASTKSKHPFLKEKYNGTSMLRTTLDEYKIIEYEDGEFKEINKKYNFPKKDIWEFDTFDIDYDGKSEIIIGTFEEERTFIEIYKWNKVDYQLMSKINVGKYHKNNYKGFVFADIDGNSMKEIITFGGYAIYYQNGLFQTHNVLSEINRKFLVGPINVISVDINQDDKDELVIFSAIDEEKLYEEYNYEAFVVFFD